MSIDVEYAIKKDIRNNPVVREIDAQQKQDFLHTAFLITLMVAAGLFAEWRHVEIVQNGYTVEQLRKDLADEATQNRKLRLEVEVLRSPNRIENIAVTKLHMVAPTPGDTLVIERADSSTPDKTIVASIR